MSRISINGISFDPAGPSIAAADAASPDTSKSNYILVQTTAPLSDADKAKLSELGVEIQEYVSENTYLCRYAPSDLTAIRALPFVSWAGVYLQGFKVNPSLRPPVSAAQTNAIGPLEAASSVSRTLRLVDIVVHDDVDPNSADFKAKVAAAAHVSPDTLTVNRRKIWLNVQERFLNDVAAIDEVRHIEEVRGVKLYNNVARDIIAANVAINGTPFQGAGQIVVVNDTGFDNGSTTNTHPAFTGRVVALCRSAGRAVPTIQRVMARMYADRCWVTDNPRRWEALFRGPRRRRSWSCSRCSTRAEDWPFPVICTICSSRPMTATRMRASTPIRGAQPSPGCRTIKV